MEKRKFVTPKEESEYWKDPNIQKQQKQIIEGGIGKAYFPSVVGSIIAILGAIIVALLLFYIIVWIAINIKSLIW